MYVSEYLIFNEICGKLFEIKQGLSCRDTQFPYGPWAMAAPVVVLSQYGSLYYPYPTSVPVCRLCGCAWCVLTAERATLDLDPADPRWFNQ